MQKLTTGTLRQILPAGALALAAMAPVLALSEQAEAKDIFSAIMQGGATQTSNWDVKLGGGLLYAPKYEGSDKHELKALPYVEIIWNEALFLSPLDGLGVNLLSHQGFDAGLAVGYDAGRDEKDSRSELNGMGNIDDGVTGSAFLSYDFGFGSAKSEVKHYFAGSEGTTVDLGVKTFLPISLLLGQGMPDEMDNQGGKAPRVPAISLGFSTQWADKDYMQSYFGVSSAQAVASGKPAYKASAGFKSVSVETGLYVPVSEHVMLGSMLTYTRLVGDAADSPIAYNDNQLSGAAFLLYEF